MTVSDVLSGAADAIVERGHAKGHYVNGAGGVCTAGAAYIAVGMKPVPGEASSEWPGYTYSRMAICSDAIEAFTAFLGESVTGWNDAEHRTQEEVVKTLRAAAQRYAVESG